MFPLIRVGMMDASMTRRPSRPRTRSCWSTTAISSSPILQEPTGGSGNATTIETPEAPIFVGYSALPQFAVPDLVSHDIRFELRTTADCRIAALTGHNSSRDIRNRRRHNRRADVLLRDRRRLSLAAGCQRGVPVADRAAMAVGGSGEGERGGMRIVGNAGIVPIEQVLAERAVPACGGRLERRCRESVGGGIGVGVERGVG